MSQSKRINLNEVASLIKDGATISVSSSSGLGCPDAVLKAIGHSFVESNAPRDLTTIHPIAAGDMYGIDGIDHIAYKGLIKRVIAGSYPSGPSSSESPKIWQMIINNEIEAYNLPSGILFHMHREAAANRPGILTKVGWDTVVDPTHKGGRMNDVTTDELVERIHFDGEDWLYFRSIPVDVAIIRGTTADARGNISMEHEGASLGVVDQALAARNNGGIVIAQVKKAGDEPIPTQDVHIPGHLIDYIVVDADQMQTTQTQYEPAISGETRINLDQFEPLEFDVPKVIARRATMELVTGDTVNLGFGISALVPYILLEEDLHGAVTWVIEQGATGGIPLRDFQFGCASNAEAIVPSPDQFTFFQGGGFNRSLLSFMQVGEDGSVNVSRLAKKPHVTAGIGGFIDITANAKRIIFSGYFTAGGLRTEIKNGELKILQEGKFKKFVPDIEEITFNGTRAIETNQEVLYITERCVLKLEAQGLTVVEIAPGIRLQEDVINQAEIPLHVSLNLTQMDKRLFKPESMGLALKSQVTSEVASS